MSFRRSILTAVPAMICLLLSVSLANGAAFSSQLNSISNSGLGARAALEEASSGDKMSSTVAEPPRRFHAIFRASPEPKSSSAAVTEQMMMGAGDRAAVDNSTKNGGNHKNRFATKQCREGCLGKVIIISLSAICSMLVVGEFGVVCE